MKKRTAFLHTFVFISLLLGGCRHQQIETQAPEDKVIPQRRETLEEPRYVPGEVLVRFKEELTNEEKTALIDKWHFKLIEKVVLTDIYRLRVPAGITVSEAIEKLKKLEGIKHAQPNWIHRMRER